MIVFLLYIMFFAGFFFATGCVLLDDFEKQNPGQERDYPGNTDRHKPA